MMFRDHCSPLNAVADSILDLEDLSHDATGARADRITASVDRLIRQFLKPDQPFATTIEAREWVVAEMKKFGKVPGTYRYPE